MLAIPTESSWGLAVDPTSDLGVETVFAIKGRSELAPLPVVAADVAQILALGVAPDDPGVILGARFWPAPLSTVVGLERPVAASRGRSDLAVRVPAHPELRAFLSALGGALTATSANRSGTPPLLDESELEGLLVGFDAAVLGRGRLPGGPPSTLIGFDPAGAPEVLRAGRFPWPPQAPVPTPLPTPVPTRGG